MWNDQTLHHPNSKTIASAAATTATVQSTITIRCFGSLNILISGGDNTDPAQVPVNLAIIGSVEQLFGEK